MSTQSPYADPFVERFDLGPSGSGVLDGLRFAVKDIIDVRGHVTGGGTLPGAGPTRRRQPTPFALINSSTLAGGAAARQ